MSECTFAFVVLVVGVIIAGIIVYGIIDFIKFCSER